MNVTGVGSALYKGASFLAGQAASAANHYLDERKGSHVAAAGGAAGAHSGGYSGPSDGGNHVAIYATVAAVGAVAVLAGLGYAAKKCYESRNAARASQADGNNGALTSVFTVPAAPGPVALELGEVPSSTVVASDAPRRASLADLPRPLGWRV